MKKFMITVGLITLLLAGCASAPESTPLPTSTFTSKPTSTHRIFPSPTRYKTQTTTPSFTPTITRTPHPTSTLPPFPTPKGGYVKYLGVESISPTGKWIAWWIDCREETDNPYNQCLEFINNDGTLTWTVGDFGVDLKSPTGSYTHVAHWSVDNRFVFLVSYPMEVEWIFRPAVHKIIKYSLVNGMSTYILAPREDPNNSPFYLEYNYGFSNDSRWLVYADLNGLSANFTLLNLFTGEVN